MTVARLLLALVAVSGCSTTFAREAVQPNPVKHPTETLRSSEQITIITGQMGLEAPDPTGGPSDPTIRHASVAHPHRYPLINQASFTMVSRDRLRFHVQIDHTWEEWADLNTWEVSLSDDRGRHWLPESVEHARRRVITTMWDRETRTQVCDQAGRSANGNCFNTIGVLDDGWRNRQALGSISVFRGHADFVFYERDIMTPDVRWMKLVVKRPGQSFEFTWRFEEEVAER
jgi:hypothetical protein